MTPGEVKRLAEAHRADGTLGLNRSRVESAVGYLADAARGLEATGIAPEFVGAIAGLQEGLAALLKVYNVTEPPRVTGAKAGAKAPVDPTARRFARLELD